MSSRRATGLGSVVEMQLEITDEAAELLDKRGGSMAIDFVRSTG